MIDHSCRHSTETGSTNALQTESIILCPLLRDRTTLSRKTTMHLSIKQVLVCTIVLVVVIGTYYNSRQITRLKPLFIDHDLPSTTGRANRREGHINRERYVKNEFMRRQRASCLKARRDTVPPSLFGKLPRPFINLGFPKMGESKYVEMFCFLCGVSTQQTEIRSTIHDNVVLSTLWLVS